VTLYLPHRQNLSPLLQPDDLQFPLLDSPFLWQIHGTRKWFELRDTMLRQKEGSEDGERFVCDLFRDVQKGSITNVGKLVEMDVVVGLIGLWEARRRPP
jgi:hypothetical protein